MKSYNQFHKHPLIKQMLSNCLPTHHGERKFKFNAQTTAEDLKIEIMISYNNNNNVREKISCE